jgi:hypothetical protein
MLCVMQPEEIRDWWQRHRTKFLRFGLVLMTATATGRLGYEFWRLLFASCPPGAIDLNIIFNLTHDWFSGIPFPTMYPPAAYPLFWLFYGWLPLAASRWLWALTSAALLIGLAFLFTKAIGSNLRLERFFWFVFFCAIYPTAITIGNGQLTLHILFPLLASMLLIENGRRDWRTVLLTSSLLLFALVKPTITLPFLRIVLFAAGSLRILAAVATGYAALTFFSFSFQENGWIGFLEGLKFHSAGIFMHRGYANLYAWFGSLDLEAWAFPGASLVFLALGLWCYRHRHSDLWLRLGVVAIVARLWIYHRLYDDLLIVIPMIALLRMSGKEISSQNSDIKAGLLLFLSWGGLLVPGTLYRLPPPWGVPFQTGHALIWIAMLIFLVCHAERLRKLNLDH